MRDKVTVPAIHARKGGPKLKVVTAYDTPSAQIADNAGADIILIGDTLAHVVLGFEDTLPATRYNGASHCCGRTRKTRCPGVR